MAPSVTISASRQDLVLIRDGPYAGADTVMARRFGLVVQGLAGPVVVGLALVYPPTVAFGREGWIALAALVAVALGGLVAIARASGERIFAAHLGAMWSLAIALTGIQWLAGGWGGAPYHELYLALLVCVAQMHPPRRAALYFISVVALTLAPIAYGGLDGRVGELVVTTGLWALVVLFNTMLMARLREQRTLLLAGQDEAQDEARLDALTGLANRRAFEETIEAALAHARANGATLALAVGDVDRFKHVNDRHGHLAGDRCLMGVAAVLRSASRSGDRAFRWGGDEFAVLLEGAGPAEVAAACARLEAEVRATVRTPDGAPVLITFGWTLDTGAAVPEALVAAADGALLARKREQRSAAA
jgi:diguanylate cyclase (GGDEF)-like protein